MNIVDRLHRLFEKYDKEKELFLEYVKREGMIRDEVKRWPHVDEDGRPE